MNDILKIVLIFFAYSTFMNKIIEKYLMINQTSFQILEFESITDFVSKITKEFGMPFLASLIFTKSVIDQKTYFTFNSIVQIFIITI